MRRTAIGTAALITAGLLGPAGARAQAAPVDPAAARDVLVAGGISGQVAARLTDQLGAARTGGVYLDRSSQRLVVTVTDEAAAETVRAAGGVAEVVAHSAAELAAITETLNQSVDLPGGYWGTSPEENQVVVTVPVTVAAANYATLEQVVAPFGDAVEIVRGQDPIELQRGAGYYIKTLQGRQCSSGFNVRKKNNPSDKFIMTAGHCTVGTTSFTEWIYANNVSIGFTAGGYFPERDWGIIDAHAGHSTPGNVYLHNGDSQDISHSRDASINEGVCHSGYVTGYRCGFVRQFGVTGDFTGGKVYDLVLTSYCSRKGDSGGPVFSGTAAIGIHVGGSETSCSGLYQRLNPALSWYGVEVY
ncbi:S1 family peptidase [Actinomycetes bacterium KLBMP 9797]